MWCFVWESDDANTWWLCIFDHDAVDGELAQALLLEGVAAIFVFTSFKHSDALSWFHQLHQARVRVLPPLSPSAWSGFRCRVSSFLVGLAVAVLSAVLRNLVSMRFAVRCIYFAFIYKCLMLALSLAKVDLACNQGSISV